MQDRIYVKERKCVLFFFLTVSRIPRCPLPNLLKYKWQLELWKFQFILELYWSLWERDITKIFPNRKKNSYHTASSSKTGLPQAKELTEWKHSLTPQQTIGLRIYWVWPRPPEQDSNMKLAQAFYSFPSGGRQKKQAL